MGLQVNIETEPSTMDKCSWCDVDMEENCAAVEVEFCGDYLIFHSWCATQFAVELEKAAQQA